MRVCVLGDTRSGATAFGDLVASALGGPYVGEVFYPANVTSNDPANMQPERNFFALGYRATVDDLAAYFAELGRRAGERFCAKVMFHDLYLVGAHPVRPGSPTAVLTEFVGRFDRVLVLYRRNKLRAALSEVRANREGVYHHLAGAEQPRLQAAAIDPALVETGVRERVFAEQAVRFMMRNLAHRAVFYEDVFGPPDRAAPAVEALGGYLDVDMSGARSGFAKSAEAPYGAAENLDELLDELLARAAWD
jgi:LPS sulfotransferase NodH